MCVCCLLMWPFADLLWHSVFILFKSHSREMFAGTVVQVQTSSASIPASLMADLLWVMGVSKVTLSPDGQWWTDTNRVSQRNILCPFDPFAHFARLHSWNLSDCSFCITMTFNMCISCTFCDIWRNQDKESRSYKLNQQKAQSGWIRNTSHQNGA